MYIPDRFCFAQASLGALERVFLLESLTWLLSGGLAPAGPLPVSLIHLCGLQGWSPAD